jgi:hypothetical protein
MLCGQGVVAVWNDITDGGRADFYAWHLTEHMPERIGIPGFQRGRRYRAIDQQTQPEFFTLYELESFEITTSQDYLSRLNTPTPWTKKATAEFRNTSRGLGRVLKSLGPGSGGVLATIRFSVASDRDQTAGPALIDLMQKIALLPMIAGAHLVATDAEASVVKTAESKDRKDIQMPPNWFAMVEACTVGSLDEPIRQVVESGLVQRPQVGRYIHEYTRLKTDYAPG